MLKNTTLRRKLWLPPIVGGVFLFFLFAISMWLGSRVDVQLEGLDVGHYPSVTFRHDLHDIVERMQWELRDAVAGEDAHSVRATDALRDRFLSRVQEETDNLILAQEDLDELSEVITDYHAAARTAGIETIAKSGRDPNLNKSWEQARLRLANLDNQLKLEGDSTEQKMLAVLQDVRASESRLAKAHGMFWLLCVAALTWVSWGMASDATSLIERLRDSAAKVADGELSEDNLVFDEADQTRRDEIGQLVRSFSAMRSNLRILVAGAGTAATSVKKGARGLQTFHKELARARTGQEETMSMIDTAVVGIAESIDTIGETMDDISKVAVENSSETEKLESSSAEAAASLESQVGAVDQVATSTAELGVSIKKIAENAQFLNRSAAGTAGAVEELGRATDEVSSRAEDTARVASEFNERSQLGQRKAVAVGKSAAKVQEASSQLVELMDNLSTRLQVVGQINSVIQDIVDETTLLSLNARIVSAQAGTRGKSFAVVAEAIKDLAGRAGKSTDEIRNALTLIQQDAGLASAAVEANVVAVEDGARLSQELASELDRIGDGANRCLENMSEISAACEEQSQGITEVRNAVKQVSSIADQVELGTNEQASATELVHGAVEDMLGSIERIRQASADQRKGTVAIALGATNLADQVEEVSRAMDETRRRGVHIRNGLFEFAMIRDQSRDAAEIVGEEVTDLVDKTKELSAQLESFRL
ncbi:MAG: methyl-accepting chemotaxis protein [Myxococcota bacterium]|nr:methyl-accepting chemotaxis protein [Myxococcota bacterium]